MWNMQNILIIENFDSWNKNLCLTMIFLQKARQVEQMLIAGDTFSESDLVNLVKMILNTPRGISTLNI